MFIVNSMELLKTAGQDRVNYAYMTSILTASCYSKYTPSNCLSMFITVIVLFCLIVFLRMASLPSCMPVAVVILMLYHFCSPVGPRWTCRTRWATNSNLTVLSVHTPDTTSSLFSTNNVWSRKKLAGSLMGGNFHEKLKKVFRIHSCGVNFNTSVQTSVVDCHPQDWICVPGP